MSTSIKMNVPEEHQSRKTIIEYYSYLKNKEEVYCEEEDDIFINHRKKRDLENYEHERFLISNPIDKKLRSELDWEEFSSLFGENNCIKTEQELEEIIEIFKDIKNQIDTKRNYECSLEVGVIGLCEFALKKGYSLSLLS